MDKTIKIASIMIILFIIVVCSLLFLNSEDDGVVDIAYIPSDHEAALFVADAQEQYAKEGIKTKLVQFEKGGDLMIAMASGSVDIGYVGVTPTLSAIEKGVPVKIISAVQTEGSGIVVANNSGINSVHDLAGKKIATPGDSSIQYLLLNYYLKQNGMSLEDVDVLAMEVPAMNDAIHTNKIDAMVTFEPYVTTANENGANVLVDSDEILPNHPCCVVVASDKFIKNHPDEAKKIIEIHENTTSYINNNTDEVAKFLPDDIVIDQEVEKKALSKFTFISGLDEDYKNDVMKFMDIEVELGLLKQPLSPDKIFREVS